jgi:predicted  nucleic acid-binding Zn-ribbon protein
MMKNYVMFAGICFYVGIYGQSVDTREGNDKFSTGSQNAVITTIYENKAGDVISEWKKVLKANKCEKVSDSGNEVFGDNVLITEWGNNTVDFYTKFTEDKKAKTIKMSVAVDLGGTYLTSAGDKNKFNYVEKMAKDFAVRMTKEPITEMLKVNTKQLEKLEGNQKDLEKKNASLKQEVVDYKTKITKAEKELVDNGNDIEKKKSEVGVQRKVVDASSGAVTEQAKSSVKILEKLEGQQKDLEKSKKNLTSDIEGYQKKITKIEAEIKTNEEKQVTKKAEIETQKKLLEDTKKRLDSVD